MVKIFLFFLSFILFSTSNFPQKSDQDINTEFNLAVKLFETLQYQRAYDLFIRIAEDYDYNTRTEVSLLFSGKCLVEMKKYSEAENKLLKFKELYPNSSYSDEAGVTLAKAYYQQKNFKEAFSELTNVIQNSEDEYYLDFSKETGRKIALNYLSIGDVRNIYDLSTEKKLKAYLLLIIGKLYQKNGDYSSAKSTYLEIVQNYPLTKEKEEAAELYKDPPKPNSNQLVSLIGVLLPLNNGSESPAAKEILEGIKFALSEFNNGRENKIGLLVRNTGLNRDTIETIKKEFENIPQVKVLLGPVYSSEVKDALEIFNDSGLPIVSPTATENELTLINENFFQANPPFSVRGKIMAQYIFYVENKRKIALLNAIEGYSPLMATTFRREFESLGGSVVVNETYKSNSIDLSTPVSNIAKFKESIDGIYIPLADKVDAPIILSHLAQNEINVPIYGNQDWLQATGYETSTAVNNNLTFTSDYFIEFNDEDFTEFSKIFYNKTRQDVNRNALYGYDAAKYILTILRNVSNERRIIKEKMMSGVISSGYHNNISFDRERINKFLNIVRYKDGRFELVDKFRSGN